MPTWTSPGSCWNYPEEKRDLTKEQNFSVLNVFNIKAPKLGGLRFVILTLKASNETLDTLIGTKCAWGEDVHETNGSVALARSLGLTLLTKSLPLPRVPFPSPVCILATRKVVRRSLLDVGEWAHTQTHTHCLRAQRKVEGEWKDVGEWAHTQTHTQGHRFQWGSFF